METRFEICARGAERFGNFDGDGEMEVGGAFEIEGRARGEEVHFVAGEDEFTVWRDETEFAGSFSPSRESDAGVEDGELERSVNRCFAAWCGKG